MILLFLYYSYFIFYDKRKKFLSLNNETDKILILVPINKRVIKAALQQQQ